MFASSGEPLGKHRLSLGLRLRPGVRRADVHRRAHRLAGSRCHGRDNRGSTACDPLGLLRLAGNASGAHVYLTQRGQALATEGDARALSCPGSGFFVENPCLTVHDGHEHRGDIHRRDGQLLVVAKIHGR